MKSVVIISVLTFLITYALCAPVAADSIFINIIKEEKFNCSSNEFLNTSEFAKFLDEKVNNRQFGQNFTVRYHDYKDNSCKFMTFEILQIKENDVNMTEAIERQATLLNQINP